MDNENISSTLPLPKEKMPECWNQEERMSSLFSPFRSRSANSQDWISKYKFWHNLIYEWLQHNMQCSFSILDINRAFKRKGCTPHCIVTVIEELLRYYCINKYICILLNIFNLSNDMQLIIITMIFIVKISITKYCKYFYFMFNIQSIQNVSTHLKKFITRVL